MSRPAFLALLQPCLAGVSTGTNEKCVGVHLDDEGVEIVRPRYQDPPVLSQIRGEDILAPLGSVRVPDDDLCPGREDVALLGHDAFHAGVNLLQIGEERLLINWR